MMIYDVKEDPILKEFSQEPSTYSKYNIKYRGFLNTYNHARAEIWQTNKKSLIMTIHKVKDDVS